MARVVPRLLLLWLHFSGCASARTRSDPALPHEDEDVGGGLGASFMQLASSMVDEVGFRTSHVAQRRGIGQMIMSKAGIELAKDVASLFSGPIESRTLYDVEVEAYARQFRRMYSRRSLAFFQHVSKTAGTLLCSAGEANGCRTPDNMGIPDAINCNMVNDRLIWRPALNNTLHPDPEQRPQTCTELSAMYAAANVTLASNENYLIADGLCRGFLNVMLFRDPIQRLISQLSMDAEFSVKHQTGREYWEEAPARPEVVFGHLPTSSNNFFIRSLLGRDVYMLPFGAVTPVHLEKAKRVLEEFDVVLIGDTDDPARLTIDIRTALGWKIEEHVDKNEGQTGNFTSKLNWSQGDWDAVRAANALDIELWEHAKALNLIDRCVFMHPAFGRGSRAMPHQACGYLSK